MGKKLRNKVGKKLRSKVGKKLRSKVGKKLRNKVGIETFKKICLHLLVACVISTIKCVMQQMQGSLLACLCPCLVPVLSVIFVD